MIHKYLLLSILQNAFFRGDLFFTDFADFTDFYKFHKNWIFKKLTNSINIVGKSTNRENWIPQNVLRWLKKGFKFISRTAFYFDDTQHICNCLGMLCTSKCTAQRNVCNWPNVKYMLRNNGTLHFSNKIITIDHIDLILSGIHIQSMLTIFKEIKPQQ